MFISHLIRQVTAMWRKQVEPVKAPDRMFQALAAEDPPHHCPLISNSYSRPSSYGNVKVLLGGSGSKTRSAALDTPVAGGSKLPSPVQLSNTGVRGRWHR